MLPWHWVRLILGNQLLIAFQLCYIVFDLFNLSCACKKISATGLHLDLLWLIERWKATRPERSQLPEQHCYDPMCVFSSRNVSIQQSINWDDTTSTRRNWSLIILSPWECHVYLITHLNTSWGVEECVDTLGMLHCIVYVKRTIFVCTLFESTHVILFEASRSFRLR